MGGAFGGLEMPVVRRGKGCVPGEDGKTGTSQDNRDAWFVGFTDNLIAAVWLGNDDNSPMKNVSGSNLPAEIWQKIMITAQNLN